MFPALLLAAACAGWHADAAGFYRGEVESAGPTAVDSWIEDTPSGLAGRYVLHEATRDVDGTLEAMGDDGCDVARFKWIDRYGSGIVRLRFDPERHCFEGNWGLDAPLARYPWRTCAEGKVTS